MGTRSWHARRALLDRLRRGFEIAVRGPVDYRAFATEARAVTRAVPRPLGRVPGHNAAQVRADRGAFMQHACRVAVGRDLRQSAPQDRTRFRGNLGFIANVARTGVPRDVLLCDVEVFLGEFADAAKLHTRRLVERLPWIASPLDQVA